MFPFLRKQFHDGIFLSRHFYVPSNVQMSTHKHCGARTVNTKNSVAFCDYLWSHWFHQRSPSSVKNVMLRGGKHSTSKIWEKMASKVFKTLIDILPCLYYSHVEKKVSTGLYAVCTKNIVKLLSEYKGK